MNRERQIVQDIDGERRQMLQFSTTDEVAVLDYENVERHVEVPARIKGRFKKRTVTAQRLARTATYASLSELYEATHSTVHQKDDDDPWTLSDMPGEVLERFESWTQQGYMPTESVFRSTLHTIAETPIDRMTAIQACPDCPDHASHLCHTSGSTRELYRYPLIQMRDEVANRVYDVPLDIALYIDIHPDRLQYGAKPKFSEDGFMSARYQATLLRGPVSAEYVRMVTDGAIHPQAKQLSMIPSGVDATPVSVDIGGWQENGFNTYMKDMTSEQLAESLQMEAMTTHAECASGVDYNAVFLALRRRLGRNGLTLAFRYKYEGMGESSAEFLVLNDGNEVQGSVTGINAHEALTRLDSRLVLEKR